jgi:hypothetical protein
MALQARHRDQAALKALAAAAAGLLVACASGPVPPAWKTSAHGALGEYEAAYLRGETRVAQVEFARARKAIASTGRIELVAQAELLRCALRTASLEFDDCPGFAALAADATPAERAYAAYLSGRWQGLDASLLPEPQRAVAARGEGALAAIQDPVSRLVASGALFRAGRLEPAGIAAAVDTASANGWRRPLLAWLGVEQKRAEQAGDRRAAELIRRRIELVSGSGS